MKLREVKELRAKNAEELTTMADGIAQELFQLKIRHGVGQLENTTRMRELRRDLARVNTELRARAGQQSQASSEQK